MPSVSVHSCSALVWILSSKKEENHQKVNVERGVATRRAQNNGVAYDEAT